MRTRRREIIALIASVAVLAAGGTALASQLLDTAGGYTGCLTQNGDLLRFAAGDSPLKPCTGSQVQVHFASDLTSLISGTGLTDSRDNGVITLSIDPTYRLPQGCEVGQVPRWDGAAWQCGDAEPGPLPQ